MREIEFRGKRIDTGEWIYGSLVEEPYGNPSISDHSSVTYSRYEVDPDTIGQFTGLRDKNGVAVFEGDIVNLPLPFGKRANAEIFWSDTASFRATVLGGMMVVSDLTPDDIEIIGNRFDNPELNKEPTNAR